MRPFRFYKNIEKPNHKPYPHCFVFFVDKKLSNETFIHRDLDTDFQVIDYNDYIENITNQLYNTYKQNVKIEGFKLGLWEYNKLLEIGVPKL